MPLQRFFSQDTADCTVTEYAPVEVEHIKSNDNVKCEPEVLIKVEDVSNTVSMAEGEESDTDTETDSESESESDSNDNTGAEDSHHETLSALAEHNGQQEGENTVLVLGSRAAEASTSQGINQFEKYVDNFCCTLVQFFVAGGPCITSSFQLNLCLPVSQPFLSSYFCRCM
jgi:hypothetical protein